MHARDKAATLSTSSFSSGICTAPAAAGGRTSFQALPLPKKLQLDLKKDPSERKEQIAVMQTFDKTSVFLLLCSTLFREIFAADHGSDSTEQNQSSFMRNSKNFSDFSRGEETFEVESSLELLNDLYSSGEVVTSSSGEYKSEFSDNLKDILKEEEDEDGSTYATEDSGNFYENNDNHRDGEKNNIAEKENDLNDESDIDVTTAALANEENVLATGMEPPDETPATMTKGSSTTVEQEEPLVEEPLVECFYVAPSSTFASLPDSISCSCGGTSGIFKVFIIIVIIIWILLYIVLFCEFHHHD